jgi:hypothetical protein
VVGLPHGHCLCVRQDHPFLKLHDVGRGVRYGVLGLLTFSGPTRAEKRGEREREREKRRERDCGKGS